MTEEELNKLFQLAVSRSLDIPQASLPQDVQLRLYAYYKQASFGTIDLKEKTSTSYLRDAFKMNAWMQISHLSIFEAKEKYIQIINSIIENNPTNEEE